MEKVEGSFGSKGLGGDLGLMICKESKPDRLSRVGSVSNRFCRNTDLWPPEIGMETVD